MGAIHELREEYRHYRASNPGYRWLFLIVDLASLLLKLALVAGFLFLCWYITNRSPFAETNAGTTDKTVPVAQALGLKQTTDFETPELTDERIALLRKIAGQDESPDDSTTALVGNVSVDSNNNLLQPNEEPTVTTTPVQVASLGLSNTVDTNTEADVSTTVPGLVADEQSDLATQQSGVSFVENVFLPKDAKGGDWVLQQDSSDYTIQLALTVNVPFLVDFARKLPGDYDAAIFPERWNNSDKIQYSLSLGSFPSKRAAETALADLAKDLKRYGAHVRPIDEVQATLTGFIR